MFTGIIEQIGTIKKIDKKSFGKRFFISAKLIVKDLNIGDSVSLNGVCLTIIDIKGVNFSVDIVKETLNRSNLGKLKVNSKVNLERAMKLSARLGGHLVQGHIESVGVITDIQKNKNDQIITINVDPEWIRYCLPKGSIALDGISLTIASIDENNIKVAIIPHTLKNTTLSYKKIADTINIETDIVGKYIDRFISFDIQDSESDMQIIKSLKHIQYGES